MGWGFYLILSVGFLFFARLESTLEADRIEAERRRRTEEFLGAFTYTEYIVSSDYLNALIMDEQSEMLHIARRSNEDTPFFRKSYPFNKILEVAMVEDNEIISLFPRSGLLKGGLIANERNTHIYVVNSDEDADEEEENISKLCLKIVIDNLANPIIEYIFMENEESMEKEADDYKEVYKLCSNWYEKVSVIIKRTEYARVNINRWN